MKELDKDSRPGSPLYLIHEAWLSKWRDFLKNADAVNPGPITNCCLLVPATGLPRPNMLHATHYRGLAPSSWYALQSIYGGGPVILRRTGEVRNALYLPEILG